MSAQLLALAVLACAVCYGAVRVAARNSTRARVGLLLILSVAVIPTAASSILGADMSPDPAALLSLGLMSAAALEAVLSVLDRERRSSGAGLLGSLGWALLVMWFAGLLTGVAADALPTWGAAMPVLGILLCWQLRPSLADLTWSADRLFVATSWMTLALAPTGILSQVRWLAELNYVAPSRLIDLSWLGLPGRWAGPFPHPNNLGLFAAVAVTYALWRGGRLRWWVGLPSLALLLMSGSFGALAALVAGAATLFVFRRASGITRRSFSAAVVVATTAAFLVWLNASSTAGIVTLTGRTTFWGLYWEYIQQKPLLGWGPDAGRYLVSIGVLPYPASQAHNLLLNTLFISGLLGLVCTGVCLVLMLLRSLSAARTGLTLPLALLAVLGVTSVTETPFNYLSFNVAWAILLIVWVSVSSGRATDQACINVDRHSHQAPGLTSGNPA